MYDMREAPSPAEQRQAEAQRRLEELGKRTLEQHDAHQPHVAVGKIARADMEHGSHDHALDQPTQATLQALREMASALELVHRASVTSGAAQSPQFRSRVDIVQQSLARATQLLRSPALRDHVQATQTVAVLRQLSSDISALPAAEATPPTAATQPTASAPASSARPLSLSLGETESASGTPAPPTTYSEAADSVATGGGFTSRLLQAHDAQTDRDAGLERTPDAYIGTGALVLDSSGAPISASGQRVVAGTSTRADAGFAVTPQLDAIERVHDTTTVSSPSDAPGVTVAVSRGSRTRWDAAGVTDETSGSTQRSQLDVDAMNAAATAELRARYQRLEAQHHQADTEIEDLEHTLSTTPEQQQRDLRRRRAALAIADRRRVADMAELERDLNQLATDDDEASLRAVIASHSLQIAPVYRTTGTASSRQRTRGLAEQRRRDLLQRLHQYKHEEQAIFAQVRPMIRHSLCSEGTRTDGWFQSGHADEMQASARMHDVANLHEAWIARIVELRAICTTLQLPRTAWGVSAGPQQPRNPETEPAIDPLITIHTIDTGSIASNGSLPARTDTAAQWRRRFEAY